MSIELQYQINNDPKQKVYLREHSYWYKYLNRNPLYYREFLSEVKKNYKMTTADKFNKVKENVEMISTFLDVLK